MEYPQVYPHSADVARQNDELDVFRESNRLNSECAKAVNAAIQGSNYKLYHYDLPAAAQSVIGEYGAERVQWVLAHTLQQKNWDGRFSQNNKEWANGFDIPDLKYSSFSIETHSAILDGFVNQVRKAIMEKAMPAQEQASVTPAEYKYYSVRRPVDIGTIPREPKPEKVSNFDWRMPVENGAFEAWGSVTYKQPLTEAQVKEYELRAASSNPREKPSVIDALKDTPSVPAKPKQDKQAGRDSGPEI